MRWSRRRPKGFPSQIAHRGSLFWPRSGRVPLSQQAKLLTALEDGEVRRSRSEGTTEVEVRVLTAGSRTLFWESEAGRFPGYSSIDLPSSLSSCPRCGRDLRTWAAWPVPSSRSPHQKRHGFPSRSLPKDRDRAFPRVAAVARACSGSFSRPRGRLFVSPVAVSWVSRSWKAFLPQEMETPGRSRAADACHRPGSCAGFPRRGPVRLKPVLLFRYRHGGEGAHSGDSPALSRQQEPRCPGGSGWPGTRSDRRSRNTGWTSTEGETRAKRGSSLARHQGLTRLGALAQGAGKRRTSIPLQEVPDLDQGPVAHRRSSHPRGRRGEGLCGSSEKKSRSLSSTPRRRRTTRPSGDPGRDRRTMACASEPPPAGSRVWRWLLSASPTPFGIPQAPALDHRPEDRQCPWVVRPRKSSCLRQGASALAKEESAIPGRTREASRSGWIRRDPGRPRRRAPPPRWPTPPCRGARRHGVPGPDQGWADCVEGPSHPSKGG